MGMTATLLSLALVAGLSAGAALADPGGRGYHHDRDHDLARAALASGAIRPLNEVLAAVAAATPGDVVDVELEQERGRWVYEVKVIATDGRLHKLYVDAATAQLSDHGDN